MEDAELQPNFDASWQRQALAGQADAVAALADTALLPLFRFCFHRVGGNRHLCEEVVQETLLRALKDLDKYDPARSGNQLFPWLSGLARNEIQRVLGREKNAASLQALWQRLDEELRAIYTRLDSDLFPVDLLQRDETRAMVNATMAQLPAHYRHALEAKYVENRSVRDIAGVDGATEKAVESLLTRARQAFRETFLALTRNLELELG